MYYIKLDEDMSLITTVKEPIYRGDHLNRKITYLLPMKIGEIDPLASVVYLTFIRADGAPDIVMLDRQEDLYKGRFYQYTIPVTCKLSKYAGEVSTWMQIVAGPADDPIVSKSSVNIIQITESENLDDYVGDWRSDKVLTALYQFKKQTDDSITEANEGIEKNATDIAALQAVVTLKADNIVFDPEDSTIQLTADGEPIGDKIFINSSKGKLISSVTLTEDGELMVYFDDDSSVDVGKVRGEDGKVYVPHVDEHKVLTFTIEDKAGELPDPVDMNPNDEWSEMEPEGMETDYVWELMDH